MKEGLIISLDGAAAQGMDRAVKQPTSRILHGLLHRRTVAAVIADKLILRIRITTEILP